MIQLAITYDHQLVIEGLLSTLRDEADIEVAAAYSSCADMLRDLPRTPVQIVLLDLQLADRHGIGLIPALTAEYPGLGIIILGDAENSAHIAGLMRQGCKGYLLKRNSGKDQLMRAIREVSAGGIYLEPGLKEQLLHQMLTDRRRRISLRVTQREREVLQLILQELSNQEIADRLYISLRTVETHRYNLQQKLNVRNTAGLVRVAREMGLG